MQKYYFYCEQYQKMKYWFDEKLPSCLWVYYPVQPKDYAHNSQLCAFSSLVQNQIW